MSGLSPELGHAAVLFVNLASGLPPDEAATLFGDDPEQIKALDELMRLAQQARHRLVARPRPSPPPVPEVQQQPVADEEDEDDDGGRPDVRRLMDGLPNYRKLRHVAGELSKRFGVEMVPRSGSRGNAALWVLYQIGREGLTTADIVYAFRRMEILTNGDADATRKVLWELGELRRKKWPVERRDGLWWLELPRRRP